MHCHACLHENQSQAHFCERCGERLEVVCRSCQTPVQPGARFCNACGAPVAASQEDPPSEAERRQVTVVFCDLVDSTQLAESMEPEELRELVQSYHELCAQAVERFGGHVAQFLGDGVLAYFGYPVAHEGGATAAVRAGLAIAREVEAGERMRWPIEVRIGIHSGLVVAESMGTRSAQATLPVGTTVNIAARLEELAGSNRIVVSAATRDLTRGFFEYRELGPRELKGVSAPLHVFEVVSESGAESPIEAAMRTGLTALVGRDHELRLLLERWERARSGEGATVFVIGEAGVGKSRMLLELKEHLSQEPHHRVECRCSPLATHSALYPIIDFLQRAWEFAPRADAVARLDRLEQELAPYVADVAGAVPLLAELLAIPVADGSGLSSTTPQRRKQRTLEVLAELFVAMSAEHPLLFVVEDLHWIDASSLELLTLLLDRTGGQRMLMLLLSRPGFESPWGEEIPAERIALERLDADSAAELVQRVAGGRALPAALVQELCNRADGVPLYLEELTKMLLESGQLRERDGRLEPAGPVATLALPVTLQGSLVARLDRLAPNKEVIQVAATLGRAFSYGLIRAVAQLEDEGLQAELGRLVAAGVLHVRGAPPDSSYVFKHALIQEAAYEGLLKDRRRSYHGRTADALRSHFAETVEMNPELLAHHFAGAGLAREAALAYHQAGRRALERSADVEAAGHLGRARELVGTLEAGTERIRQELEIGIDLGAALVAIKGFTAPEVEEVYERCRALCSELGESSRLYYNALSGIFLFHQARGELGTALELTHERRRIAEKLGADALTTQVHENLGTLAFWRGEFAASLDCFERALERYDEVGARELALVYGTESSVVCHTYAAQLLWFLGFPEQASERCELAVARGRKLSHANSLGLALAFGGALHQLRREPARTLEYADETVAFSTAQDLHFWRGMGMIFQGWSRFELGEVDAGIARMFEGVASFRDTGAQIGGTLTVAMLAEAYAKAGRTDEALGVLEGGLGLLGDYEDRFFDAEVLRIRGELRVAQGDGAAAEACFQESLDLARGQGAASLALRTAIGLARLLREQGRAREAAALLADAHGVFREGFDTPDLVEAAGLLAELGG